MSEGLQVPESRAQPVVDLFLFPGGRQPERMSARAIGYDVFARAIVSAFEMQDEHLRRTIFDFEHIPGDAGTQEHIEPIEVNNARQWAWRINPGERALVGIGFATELPDMPPDHESFYWVAPRSGLASKWGITVGNAPGTVDADYRGEAGVVLINQGELPFYITKHARIAQIIFTSAMTPRFNLVEKHGDLLGTERGAGGFGSTGFH